MAATLQKIQGPRGLSVALGISYPSHLSLFLYRRTSNQNYKSFEIARKGGGTRQIYAPIPPLKKIQRRLLPLLEEIYTPPPCVTGFTPGQSIKINAEKHVRHRHILNLDIKDFFPSIHFSRIVGTLTKSRYKLDRRVAITIAQIACINGELAIGSPVSGILSNIVCGPLDATLLRLAKSINVTYSRYADDITFSTNNLSAIRELVKIDGVQHRLSGEACLQERLPSIFSAQGFLINPNKISYRNYSSRQIVTGLTVNTKVNISRDYYKSLRSGLNAIERYGYAAAQQIYLSNVRKSEFSSDSLEHYLKGRIEFLGHITDWGQRYRRLSERAQAALPNSRFRRRKSDSQIYTYVIEDDFLISQGSCFHIGQGLLITSAHVAGHGTVKIYSLDGLIEDLQVRVIFRDEDIDVAIMRSDLLRSLGLPGLRLSGRVPHIGEIVTATGYPNFAPGGSLVEINCSIIGHSFRFNNLRYDLSQRLEHGASGGPVLSNSGQVLGIVHGDPEEDDGGSVANTMTPSSAFLRFAQAQMVI